MSIHTRFAPSPTGYLHIGGLRTALYNFLFAKKNNGAFILRIEDTDRERLVPGAVEKLVDALSQSGISYDEGPMLKDGAVVQIGSHGPYLQSQRLALYREHAEKLMTNSLAHYCFCTKETLETRQEEYALSRARKPDPCKDISKEDAAARAKTESHAIRFEMPRDGFTKGEDIIRGEVRFPNADQEDFIILKSDGYPTYHLASVVDDHLMEITHVIRGEEWLSSLPKHLKLYEAFGWKAPDFAHLPLILNPDKTKLSKRQGDVAVKDYLVKGYLPEALVNFILLIGYNPTGDREMYSRGEMIELFDLSKVNKGGGVFDIEKLKWMNEQYLRKLSVDKLVESVKPFLAAAKREVPAWTLKKICAVERERMTLLADIAERVDGYLAVPSYDPTLLVWKKADAADAKKNLEEMISLLFSESEAVFDSVALLEKRVLGYIKEKELKNGNVLWPMRVALSGRVASPSPFELAWVLGKNETISRLTSAATSL